MISRLRPGAEPVIIQLLWVFSDGSREDGPTFTVPAYRTERKK
jgi:hypothetical protein